MPPRPAWSSLSPAEVRLQPIELTAAPEPVGRVVQRAISGPGGSLWLRIYWPTSEGGPHPALIYMHGGGWVFGSLDGTDRTCRAITNRADCVVVSVDYRLSPETKFPGALEDTYAALSWTVSSAPELKIDGRRIAVGGFSAGGNLAAAVALMARDRRRPVVAFQLLIMPITDFRVATRSWDEFGDGPIWTRADANWSWGHYLAVPGDGDHPYASILRTPDLHRLPPALVVTGGCDPLRDEGEGYAERMRDAAVDVVVKRYEGMPHGFIGFPSLDEARKAVDEACVQLRLHVGN